MKSKLQNFQILKALFWEVIRQLHPVLYKRKCIGCSKYTYVH